MAKLTGEDFWEISNVLHLYMHALDAGDADRFAALFTADATCEVTALGVKVSGTDNLKEFCTNLHKRFHNLTHWFACVERPCLNLPHFSGKAML